MQGFNKYPNECGVCFVSIQSLMRRSCSIKGTKPIVTLKVACMRNRGKTIPGQRHSSLETYLRTGKLRFIDNYEYEKVIDVMYMLRVS